MRPLHLSVGAGGYVATGPDTAGLAMFVEALPGGRLGRWGVAARWRRYDDSGGLLLGGVTFEAGSARPQLAMLFHGELGLQYGEQLPAIGGGVQTELGLWGPLAIATDVGAHLLIDGTDSTIVVSAALTVGAAL